MGIAEVTAKLEILSQADYDMIGMLINRLMEKNSEIQTSKEIK